MYVIYPAFGSILPGQTQTITVDCIADRRGLNHEDLSIEISDLQRDTLPLIYRICAEVLVPGIEMTDVASIFEEHRVCKEIGALGQHLFHEDHCVGVYGEEERKFVFKNIIVGKTSVARFKITNLNKVGVYHKISNYASLFPCAQFVVLAAIYIYIHASVSSFPLDSVIRMTACWSSLSSSSSSSVYQNYIHWLKLNENFFP